MKAIVVLGLVLLAGSAQAQDRNGVIRDALQRGAHVVQCQSDRCQDQTTMEYLDHPPGAPDGVYLVYPDTSNNTANISRTRDAAKAASQ